MELKQNKSLPAEQQIVTANPDIVTVCRMLLLQFISPLICLKIINYFALMLFYKPMITYVIPILFGKQLFESNNGFVFVVSLTLG